MPDNDTVAVETPATPAPARRKNRKRRKKIRKILIILLILAAVALYLFFKNGKTGAAAGNANDTLSVYTVSRRNITEILTGTGTLAPKDSYTVTALATGEITEDYFEEGDEVTEDQLLMVLDSSNLESTLERARNSHTSAKEALDDLYEARDDLRIVSDYAGVLQVLNIEEGDSVGVNTPVGTVLDRETMLVDVPFLQNDAFAMNPGDAALVTPTGSPETLTGYVKEVSAASEVNAYGVRTVDVTLAVANPGGLAAGTEAAATVGDYACTAAGRFYENVNEPVTADANGKVLTLYKHKGDRVEKGDVIAQLDPKDLDKQIERAERTLREAANALADAEDAFDNYRITAPISGTIIQKNYKKGEKIGGGNNNAVGNTVAVIYDLSALQFDMNIDELDIDNIALGQTVNITCDAKTGFRYTGIVTQISVVGSTQNGTTVYPITVTVEDYGSDETGNKLRPGMNIDAEIVLKEARGVLAVPVDALGRGNRVKLIKAETAPAETPAAQTPDGENRPANSYTTLPASAAYEEITVETGVSDDDFIEITSGLAEGDRVVVEKADLGADDSFAAFRYGNMGGGNMGGGNMGGGNPGGPPNGSGAPVR